MRADRTPVLVGVGVATQREDDFRRALEPMDLMHQAVQAAGRDTGGGAGALGGVQWIAVPRGRWTYTNPAGAIARAIGAAQATTVLTSVGVLQQTLIGAACARIASGQAHTTLVAGSDAGWRLLRAQIAGEQVHESNEQGSPDEYWEPAEELRHPLERRAGLQMPVGLYAIMESAFRYAHGWSLEEHRDRIARLYADFSRIAAANPHSWLQRELAPEEIREGSQRNPMQAFPYTRFHCASWNVDQASALLFCSQARAEELGIPRSRWVYPLASTESNHMVPVSQRACLHECAGARVAGQAALEAAGLQAAQIDLVDLYSCFPIAVQAYAEALGLPLQGRELSLTGGMSFAGGPYNNYEFQATARAAELLRQGRGRTALVSCVSGVLTKQGFGLWGREAPREGFVHADVSDAVAAQVESRPVLDGHEGPARVAGYTVLHGRGQPARGVLLMDAPAGQRVLVATEDPAWVDRLQSQEWVGRELLIAGERVME
jgi:acetyl-CoA C-acetyltransferase